MNALLQAQALGKRYGRREALVDCTLEIPPGHVVGLVGPNGAGKTSTLRCLAGIIPANGGTILIGGTDLAHVPRAWQHPEP